MPDTEHTHRLNEQLLEYWKKLSKNGEIPKESSIDPSCISDIWNDCFLVNLKKTTEKRTYKYEYMGEHLLDAFGMDMTSVEMLDKKVHPYLQDILSNFEQVLLKKEPVSEDSVLTNTKGLCIKYRTCMVPLANSQGDVHYIFGSMRWKYC